jgi:uncharacterized protein YjeT (DUF2065 family)
VIEKVFFGVASALVFEGLMLALFPNRIKNAIKMIEKTSNGSLSKIGLFLMTIGILFLSLIEI